MTEIATYQEVLEMLTAKAVTGSVSALVALERALRPGDPDEDVDEVIERLLSDAD